MNIELEFYIGGVSALPLSIHSDVHSHTRVESRMVLIFHNSALFAAHAAALVTRAVRLVSVSSRQTQSLLGFAFI